MTLTKFYLKRLCFRVGCVIRFNFTTIESYNYRNEGNFVNLSGMSSHTYFVTNNIWYNETFFEAMCKLHDRITEIRHRVNELLLMSICCEREKKTPKSNIKTNS